MNLKIEFKGSQTHALYLNDVLQDLGASSVVDESGPSRHDRISGAEVALVMILVMGGAKTAEVVADLIYRMRQRYRPMMVLDLTTDEPKLTIMDEAPGMSGELVIKSREGDEIHQVHGAGQEDTLALIRGLVP